MPRKSSADIAFPASQAERLAPPDDLAGPARLAFLAIVQGVRPDYFRAGHLGLVVSYARLQVAERDAFAEQEREPVIDGKPSPWLAIWKARHSAMMSLATKLRLTPLSEYTVPTAPKEPPLPPSYFERMGLLDEDRRDDEPTQ
ncbi:hypothetical protein AB7M17_003960 [Bradyrhizobium sp. USDA 377]